MQELKLTRAQLYEQVWASPISTLSAKYKVSDYEFRKICSRMKIPLPKSGHWQKVRVGKSVYKAPLPAVDNIEQEIDFESYNDCNYNQKILSSLALLQKEIEDKHKDLLTVPPKLSDPDKLVAEAKEHLEAEKKDRLFKGVVHTYGDKISIKVSPANISRALRFFNALIKLLRTRGHHVKIKYQTTYAIVEGEEIEISLREKLHRTMVEEKHWNTAKYTPSGTLVFKMDRSISTKEWVDGKLLIEQCLSGIVANLELKAKQEIERKIKWQKHAEEQREREKIERELEARQEKELDSFKKLLQEAHRWNQVKLIREYIEDVRQNTVASNNLSDELHTWLEWASKKADWYDPQVSGADELMSKVDKDTLTLKKKFSFPSWL